MGMSVGRVAAWGVAGAIGVGYGVAATFGHATTWIGLPVGLVLALAGSAGLLLAIRLLLQDRWAALAAGLGMMLSALILAGTGPGGSVVVAAGVPGMVWTLGLPLAVALTVAWPSARRVRPRPEK